MDRPQDNAPTRGKTILVMALSVALFSVAMIGVGIAIFSSTNTAAAPKNQTQEIDSALRKIDWENIDETTKQKILEAVQEFASASQELGRKVESHEEGSKDEIEEMRKMIEIVQQKLDDVVELANSIAETGSALDP